MGGDPVAQHAAAIAAAKAAEATRVVYTSHMAASPTSAFPPMWDHATTEGMLAASGMAWTALRHGFYASSGLGMLGDALTTGRIEAPLDGKVSWTAHADLAHAAALILAHPAQFDGPTAPLTAAEALDLDDIARIATTLLGRPVTRHILTDDALRTRMAGRGVPAPVADIALGLYLASRNGEFATVDAALERLLGRAPTSLRTVMAQMLASRT
jgi:NAD(P)H dehydrogenase (quinone)